MKNAIRHFYYVLGAALYVSAADAHATFIVKSPPNTFGNISENMMKSIENIPGFLTAVAYLFGLILGILGIMKIKDHVENATQTSLKDGAIRLAAGGALFALPIVYEAAEYAIGSTDNLADAAYLNMVSFNVR
jgi:hypothetical protein